MCFEAQKLDEMSLGADTRWEDFIQRAHANPNLILSLKQSDFFLMPSSVFKELSRYSQITFVHGLLNLAIYRKEYEVLKILLENPSVNIQEVDQVSYREQIQKSVLLILIRTAKGFCTWLQDVMHLQK